MTDPKDRIEEKIDRIMLTSKYHPAKAKEDFLELIKEAVLEIPDRIKEVHVSGVAVPRNEMDKISLQDLRLVLAELEGKE